MTSKHTFVLDRILFHIIICRFMEDNTEWKFQWSHGKN